MFAVLVRKRAMRVYEGNWGLKQQQRFCLDLSEELGAEVE